MRYCKLDSVIDYTLMANVFGSEHIDVRTSGTLKAKLPLKFSSPIKLLNADDVFYSSYSTAVLTCEVEIRSNTDLVSAADFTVKTSAFLFSVELMKIFNVK